jgi:dTMP kinase
LEAAVQRGLTPDLTLLLDAPLDVGRERIRGRKADHFEREEQPFFARVRAAYRQLASRHPQRIKLVDASQPLAAVQQQIAAHLETLLAEQRA